MSDHRLQEAKRSLLDWLASWLYGQALKKLGVISLYFGKLDPAQKLLGKALAIDPSDIHCLYWRGLALLQLKKYEEAIACFDQTLAINPDSVEPLSDRATALLKIGRVEQALSGFQKAISLDSKHAKSWHGQGNAFLRVHALEDAFKCYDMAVSLEPAFEEARQSRRRLLDRLTGMNSPCADALNTRGMRLLQEGQFSEALTLFDEALEIKNVLLIGPGTYRPTGTPLEKVLEIKPDFVEVMAHRGTALWKLGQHEDALASFQSALILDPTHAQSWHNSGNVLSALKRFKEALEHYDRAIALKPDFPEARNNRSQILQLSRTTR
jgi:tetratricopeptide (TPR) repeat protein